MNLSPIPHPIHPLLLKSASDPRIAANHTHRAVFDRRQTLSIHPPSTVDYTESCPALARLRAGPIATLPKWQT